ncbi:MAG: hypothetical protein RIS73_1668, partial [Bacteroidota bacterium]|jgi:hypothetical protein
MVMDVMVKGGMMIKDGMMTKEEAMIKEEVTIGEVMMTEITGIIKIPLDSI